jgi:hypothetical protein
MMIGGKCMESDVRTGSVLTGRAHVVDGSPTGDWALRRRTLLAAWALAALLSAIVLQETTVSAQTIAPLTSELPSTVESSLAEAVTSAVTAAFPDPEVVTAPLASAVTVPPTTDSTMTNLPVPHLDPQPMPVVPVTVPVAPAADSLPVAAPAAIPASSTTTTVPSDSTHASTPGVLVDTGSSSSDLVQDLLGAVGIVDDCTCEVEDPILAELPDFDDLVEELPADLRAIADRIFNRPPVDTTTGPARPPIDTTTGPARPPIDVCAAPSRPVVPVTTPPMPPVSTTISPPPTTTPPPVATATAVGTGTGGASGSTSDGVGAVAPTPATCPPDEQDQAIPETVVVTEGPPTTVTPVIQVTPVPEVQILAPTLEPVEQPVLTETPVTVTLGPPAPQPVVPAVPPPVTFIALTLAAVPLPAAPAVALPELRPVELTPSLPPVAGPAIAPTSLLRPLQARGVGPARPSALPGGLAEATGSDCPAGSAVTLRIEGREVARTTADMAGGFSAQLLLPPDVAVGRRLVTATCGPVTLEGPLSLVQTSSNLSAGAGITTLAALLSLFMLIVLVLRATQNDRRPQR